MSRDWRGFYRISEKERNINYAANPELPPWRAIWKRLRYAINYGADAVYCSLPELGTRSAPANFTPEQLTEGVIYAHARGPRST